MGLNPKDTNAYVTECRVQATNLILTLHKMADLKDKWTALDLSNTLIDSDIGNSNTGITKAQIGAVLGVTLTEFEALMSQGHATNLHTIALI